MAYRLHTPIILGFTSAALQSAVQSVALNAAATWTEYGFLLHEDKTLNEVAIIVALVTGTPGTSIVCEITDASGAVLATATSPSITGAVYSYDFTGLSLAVAQGEQYWVRLRNTHGTPATDYVTMRCWSAETGGLSLMTGSDVVGWNQRQTTNSGGAYTYRQASAGWQLKFSDGSYQGLALEERQMGDTTQQVYQLRRFGVRFTTPVNADLRLKGLGLAFSANFGTPPAGLLAEVLNPTSVVATSLVYPSTVMATGAQRATLFFATPVVLTANSDYRVVIGMATNSGDFFNCYYPFSYGFRNTAGSRSVFPFGGTMQQTFFDGVATWTDNPYRLPIVHLFLDNDQDFSLLTGGSGAGGLVGGGMVR